MDLSHFQFDESSFIQQGPRQPVMNAGRVPQVLDHPKSIRSITVDRCSNFTSGGANGNDVNLLSQLYKARTNSGKARVEYHARKLKLIWLVFVEEYISLLVYSVPDLKRISFKEAIQQEFRPTRLGEWFGPSWVSKRESVCLYFSFVKYVFIVYSLVSCTTSNPQ